MKQLLKKGLLLIAALMLAIPCVNVVRTEAASKPSLSSKAITIGIGTYSSGSSLLDASGAKGTTIKVNNSKKGATYTFTSSNKKIATVKTSGTKGVITGVKAGKTTVTVTQKLKGKTTTVGKCKVTVKSAVVKSTSVSKKIQLGKNVTDYNLYGFYGAGLIDVAYANSDAKYKIESDKTGLSVTLKFKKGIPTLSYTATEAGDYKLTVKETYKSKTKKLGTVDITVLPVSVKPTETMYLGTDGGIDAISLMNNGSYIEYTAEIGENSYGDAITVQENQGYISEELTVHNYYITSTVTGTLPVNIYYNGSLLGTCYVEMKETKVKEINYPSSITMSVGDTGYIEEYDANFDYDTAYGVIMENEMMPVAKEGYSSSDASVVSVSSNGELTAKETGTATITVTADGVTKEVKVTVKKNDDDDDDEDEDW